MLLTSLFIFMRIEVMGRKARDLTDQKFGKLTVIKRFYPNKNGHAVWECRCDCGQNINVRSGDLLSGRTRSCGCARAIDLTGQRFGKLTVLKRVYPNKHGSAVWESVCDCGKITNVRSDNLINGDTKSCGCLHGESHGMSDTPIYKVWKDLLTRCYNKKNKAYPDYGGRGIRVNSKWKKSFVAFYNDMGDVPEKGLTIDRIDNDGNYTPENTRWATKTEQVRNTRIFKTNKTGIKGVCWQKKIKKYQARIYCAGKPIHLGYFTNLSDAAEARSQGEIKYWGKAEVA